MELIQTQSKRLLGSSTNQGELFNKTYKVEDFTFRLGEMTFYEKDLDFRLKELIISKLVNPKKSSFGDFQSEEGLELYSKNSYDKILIISAGEINRGIYKIFLEGIWKVVEKNESI